MKTFILSFLIFNVVHFVNSFEFKKNHKQMRCFLCDEILNSFDILAHKIVKNQMYCLSCFNKMRGKDESTALVSIFKEDKTTYGTFDLDFYKDQDEKEYYQARKKIEADVWKLTKKDFPKEKKRKRRLEWPFVNVGEVFGEANPENMLEKLRLILTPGKSLDAEKNRLYIFSLTPSLDKQNFVLTVTYPNNDTKDFFIETTDRVWKRGAQIMIDQVDFLTVADMYNDAQLYAIIDPKMHENLTTSYFQALEFQEIVIDCVRD